MFTLHIMKSKCPIVKFYKPFLVHVTNMSYLDILSMTVGFLRCVLAVAFRASTAFIPFLPRMRGR